MKLEQVAARPLKRVEVGRQVLGAIDRLGFTESIRGSWAHGDFHYCEKTHRSFSDLDLVMALADEERIRRSQLIAQACSLVVTVPVSIHPAEFLSEMTIEDARWLNVAEFLAKTARLPLDDAFYQYTAAKISLLLCRSHNAQRYEDVARAVGSAAAHGALLCKIGSSQIFDRLDAAKLVSVVAHEAGQTFVALLSPFADQRGVTDFVRSKINAGHSIQPWLRERILSKLART